MEGRKGRRRKEREGREVEEREGRKEREGERILGEVGIEGEGRKGEGKGKE